METKEKENYEETESEEYGEGYRDFPLFNIHNDGIDLIRELL